MLVLGIETSCDETAASVVREGREVLSSVVASQHELHAEYGGVVPEIASRAHVERLLPVVRAALRDAGVRLEQLNAVAVANRPGLIGSLVVGVVGAKALAWSLGVPFVGVDHVHAHLIAGLLREAGSDAAAPRDVEPHTTDDVFPALGLVVSGGHTAIYRCASTTDIARLGRTIDDAAGEAFDKGASILGIPHPGGPNLDALAETPGARDDACTFPIARMGRESLDFSFSGLKTALLYRVRGRPPQREGDPAQFPDSSHLSDDERRDLAATYRRAIVDTLVLKLGRALAQERDAGRGVRALLVGGGVSACVLLRRELRAFCEREGLALRLPEMRFCVDNAAMIAAIGHDLSIAGRASSLDLAAVPTTAC
ncbi:MAG: tRNA (adenosine(37)-N6)-threonylcarbamoyltransferase complex transferase subunit TsaD [Phycisphaerales bacterium]|jgi:N6-L-threonylcarbamoyladenine synthase|nr:tRNA (adenosine(37)-N6)-threonylcarbamoyltransferase complex transferase subunit TsaD [Phycisphaerales bacterium]